MTNKRSFWSAVSITLGSTALRTVSAIFLKNFKKKRFVVCFARFVDKLMNVSLAFRLTYVLEFVSFSSMDVSGLWLALALKEEFVYTFCCWFHKYELLQHITDFPSLRKIEITWFVTNVCLWRKTKFGDGVVMTGWEGGEPTILPLYPAWYLCWRGPVVKLCRIVEKWLDSCHRGEAIRSGRGIFIRAYKGLEEASERRPNLSVRFSSLQVGEYRKITKYH